MLISEKAVRIFARSILFENNENVDLMEINFSPSNGGLGLGANDQFNTNRSFHDRPTKMTDWQNDIEARSKEEDLVNVNNVSSIEQNRVNSNNTEDNGCRNTGDFKAKVNVEIENIGLDVDNEDLDKALEKITKVIKGML